MINRIDNNGHRRLSDDDCRRLFGIEQPARADTYQRGKHTTPRASDHVAPAEQGDRSEQMLGFALLLLAFALGFAVGAWLG